MTEYQKMVDSFDKLMYMIKTTAPHLQAHATDLRECIKATLAERANSPTKAVATPPPPVQSPASMIGLLPLTKSPEETQK